MDSINVSELVERLGSDEDAVRKMAVFKLQSNIGDPSFADVFIVEGGLAKLRYLVLHATGNTLSYSLTSFSKLLEVDKGWEYVNKDLVERVVELVVTHPLVNILRGAMSILVYIVSHPYTASNRISQPDSFGFRALKPAIAIYPQFLEMLVSRLSSADHQLCANALLLINSLMRDAITNGSEDEWPRFIKRLQDLGVFKSVYTLMQSTAIQDISHPLLEYQALTKVMLRRWRDMPVDMDRSDHRTALKSMQISSNPKFVSTAEEHEDEETKTLKHQEKWRRLGFGTERPVYDFEDTGSLGMIDLANFVKKDEDGFQKLLLEQSPKPAERRCPIARSSLAVTEILYEHFEVDKADVDDARNPFAFESRTNFDKVFTPMILQWSVLHTAGVKAFVRIWQATGATLADFTKIIQLVRILVEVTVGGAPRDKDVDKILAEIDEFQVPRLRRLQMELLEVTYEGNWGEHLRKMRDELHQEAFQFVKEQRIRCLLTGDWFPNYEDPKAGAGPTTSEKHRSSGPVSYRYVQLSHNRRYLLFGDFGARGDSAPPLGSLHERVDLTNGSVGAVTSQVLHDSNASSSTSTIRAQNPTSMTKITITSRDPSASHANTSSPNILWGSLSTARNTHSSSRKETELLTLYVQPLSLASEWLDGLLLLLDQKPITTETKKLINTVEDYGLKIRLLNVDFQNMQFASDAPEVPSREGLDDDYYYDVFGN